VVSLAEASLDAMKQASVRMSAAKPMPKVESSSM
jgi:hypothetical protein